MLAGLLEAGCNRVLALDPQAVDKLERVDNRILQLDLTGLGITLFFHFEFGSVEVLLDSPAEPDTRVSGSPAALFAMAAPDDMSDWGLPGSGVQIAGDAAMARDLGRIFQQLAPDWQAPLNAILGDVLGFQVASGAKRGAAQTRQSATQLLKTAGRYLNGNSDLLAEQDHIETFNGAVDDLRDGVDRLAARLDRLAAARAE
jgi:ubiquinone biosynthesis protein UbiJ